MLEMTSALSSRLGVPESSWRSAPGSVAVLYHLLQAACEAGDEVVYAWRSFEAYPIAVQLTGATQVPVPLAPGAVHDLDAMRRAVTPATKAIMLCTPNNPTGPALQHQPVIDFIDSLPDHIMIVLDEAYVEFVTDPEGLRGLDAMAGRPNVVVLRTFSKAYGLAGFRVGYCVADPRVAAAVRAVALPFGVSVAAQAAVIASLDAEPLLFDRVAELVKARDALAVGLRDLGFRGSGRSGQLRLAAGRSADPRRTQRPLPVPGWRYGRTPRAVTGMVSVSPSVSRLPTPVCWRWPQRWRDRPLAALASDRTCVAMRFLARAQGHPDDTRTGQAEGERRAQPQIARHARGRLVEEAKRMNSAD